MVSFHYDAAKPSIIDVKDPIFHIHDTGTGIQLGPTSQL